MAVYLLIDGLDDAHEIILASPLIEFETCKALADLLEMGLIRERTNVEIAEVELASEPATTPARTSASGPRLG